MLPGGFDPDLVGAFEARLLAVERRSMQLDRDLRTLRRGAVETQQRIRDSWSDFRGRVAATTPAPSGVNDFTCCSNIPTTLLIHDSAVGAATTLTYDSANKWWAGCQVFTIPPKSGGCAGFTGALRYRLEGSNTNSCAWSISLIFKQQSTAPHCPVASACSDLSDSQTPHVVNRTTPVSCTGVSTWTDTNPALYYNLASGSTVTYTINLQDGT